MALETKIEWATSTWNPWMGCTKVSPACDNCYAERGMSRFGRDFNVITRTADKTFFSPLDWDKPKRIFVCSWSDFFHPGVNGLWRQAAIDIMQNANRHTYMLLTKRPENIGNVCRKTAWEKGFPDNVWIGVTAETQNEAERRVPWLLPLKAKVKFLSCEPLLGLVRFNKFGPAINWVIAGGESGPRSRPTHPEWVNYLRNQAANARIPFFFKQWGDWVPCGEYTRICEEQGKSHYDWANNAHKKIMREPPNRYKMVSMFRVGKKAAGSALDGKTYREFPA